MRGKPRIEQLYSLRGGSRTNLEKIEALDGKFENPHRSFKSVHVAGTNGKGSVTIKVAQILQDAGFKVGTFTSPHILDFPERIQVNRAKISYDEVDAYLDQMLPQVDVTDFASFFDLSTVMAFLKFRDAQVDFGVLEVGLGGRLDATNVVTPIVSVITSISLDHTEILGTTILEIASEKAGIIKPGVPCVVGPRVPIEYFREVCERLGSPIYEVPPASSFETYEDENNRISYKVAEVLRIQGVALPDLAIETGLQAKQPLRCFVTEYEGNVSKIPVVLDVGHNPDGLLKLLESVHHKFPGKSLRIVMGMSRSKDLQSVLGVVFPLVTSAHFVSADHYRLMPFSELESLAAEICPDKVGLCGTLTSTLIPILEQSPEEEVVVVCGSFFIMKDVYEILGPVGVTLDSI